MSNTQTEQNSVEFSGTGSTGSRVKDYVDSGIFALDGHTPGWRQMINVGALKLNSPDYCVLGQVYGEFLEGLRELDLTYDDAIKLGFAVRDHSSSGDWLDFHALAVAWDELQREWVKRLVPAPKPFCA